MDSFQPSPRSYYYIFTKVEALCVHSHFVMDDASVPPSARSFDVPFESELYCFRLTLYRNRGPQTSELVLFAADGRPRRPARPFHVSVFVWGDPKREHPWQRIDRTCSLLTQGTVSEVPWVPDYDREFFDNHLKTDGDGFDLYYSVDFLFVFESTCIRHDISQCIECRRPSGEVSDSFLTGSSCNAEKDRERQKNAFGDTEQPIQTECVQGSSKSSEFPSNLDSLSQDLANLLKNETLPDVKLKCRGRDGAIPAHRAVLAARSEVFAAMFRSDMAESRSGDVDVPDVDDDVIDPFLQYVYSGKIPSGVSDEVVPGLYAAADKYAVHALKETCRRRMVSGLTEENCVQFLTVADVHGDADFKKSAIEYICNHEALLKGDAWREFAKKRSPLAIEVYDSFVENKTRRVRLDDKSK